MTALTKREDLWRKKLQKVLDECPGERLGFYTVGDNTVFLYDRNKEARINQIMDSGSSDYSAAADKAGASLNDYLTFPTAVHSVAG